MSGCDDMVRPAAPEPASGHTKSSKSGRTTVLITSFFVPGGGFGGGWTAYPPLSAQGAYSLTPLGATLSTQKIMMVPWFVTRKL